MVLADKSEKAPKRLNVTFEIKEPNSATTSIVQPSEDVNYLVVATLSDAKPAVPLNFRKKLTVRSLWWSFVWTAFLVIVSYVFIAWATFDPDTAIKLQGTKWLLFAANPVRISAASYGEASMSQLQVLIFTLIVGGLLFHLWMTTLILSDISTDLLKLIGISAVGAAGAKFTHTIKSTPNDQTARYLIGRGWYGWAKEPMRDHATFKRLLLTDGRLDVYKFQIAIFTVVVACYVLSAGQTSLGDVKISETMLYLIGISQGVYVGGKAVTDRTTDLEASVQKMIDLEQKIRVKEAALGGAARTDELKALDEEYHNAALTAVDEFTSLQNRRFPTKADAAEKKLDVLSRQIADQERSLGAAARPAALVALDTQRQQVAADAETLRQQIPAEGPQDVRNIDPAVLKP